MPAIVLVGAQWGDEGKGKATDLLGNTGKVSQIYLKLDDSHNTKPVIAAISRKYDGYRLWPMAEMERAIDTSKSTISRPQSRPSQEKEIRTEHRVLDRSGMASRFLRLAHRVGMDAA